MSTSRSIFLRLVLPAVVLPCLVLFGGCAGSKESPRVSPAPIPSEKPTLPDIDTREYTFQERYFVRDAAIDSDTNISSDPLQAMRVIQLKRGSNAVLVLNNFEKVNGSDVETWFALELPSFAPGTYDVSKALAAKFYRFVLGGGNTRYDGRSFRGTLTVENVSNDHITGSIDIMIDGITRAFNEPQTVFSSTLIGSFRIREVPLDATFIGKTPEHAK